MRQSNSDFLWSQTIRAKKLGLREPVWLGSAAQTPHNASWLVQKATGAAPAEISACVIQQAARCTVACWAKEIAMQAVRWAALVFALKADCCILPRNNAYNYEPKAERQAGFGFLHLDRSLLASLL